jgi:hypothetical protein
MTNYHTVYESPDGGHTVYSRRSGSLARHLAKSDTKKLDVKETQLWLDIVLESKQNSGLAELLDKAKSYYFLSRNEN